jgi:diguanylate cyclase (GGDEF)-like protein
MKALVLGALFLISAATWATEPNCGRPPAVKATPEYMSQVLCKAAEEGRFDVSTDSLIGQCALGAKDGAVAVGREIYDGVITLKDLGIAGVSRAARWARSAWSGEDDAAVAAENAARADGEEARGLLKTLSVYKEAAGLLLREYMRQLDENFRLVGGTMACLPWKYKLKYTCLFASHVLLDLATVKGVASAADKSATAAKAATDFARKSGTLEELKSVSLADRLKAAGDALTYQAQFKQVEKFGEVGNLRKRLDPITGEETLHFEEIARRADGRVISVMRDIPRDAKTQAIDANFEYGHKLAVLTAEKSKGDHLLFIDVNNLGKVNYFKDGTQAGDAYLKEVAAAIRKNLRPDDRFFKNGGDELVVVLKTEKPAEAKAVIERIHRAIEQDRDLQALFRRERSAKAAEIKAANSASKTPTEAQVESLRETAKIRPSVSIGSTRIRCEWASDLARAEKQAGEIKARYKSEIGLDALKYKVDGLTSGTPKLTAKPAVLDPIE